MNGEVFLLLRALYSAASGMLAQQTNVDTISHNLSNVNTNGFKKSRVEFQDLFYAHIRPAVGGSQGIMVGQGSRLSSIQRIFSNGSLQATGNPFDIAIQGQGFFRVEQMDGVEAYTRDGAFRLDGNRRLITSNGEFVLGQNGRITIPPSADEIEITADGIIRYIDAQSHEGVLVDQISLAIFSSPSGLSAQGNSLWIATEFSGQAILVNPGRTDTGRLAQGHLEASNVQTVEEMISLIVAQRAYEINSKAVQSADDMMGMANNLRRG